MYGIKEILAKIFQRTLFTTGVLFSSTCFANLSNSSWNDVIVKVISFPCPMKSPVYEGSGIIIKGLNTFSVLTSEHVLLPKSDIESCFEVYNPIIGTKKMTVKKRSFLSGLAELSFSDNEGLESIKAQNIQITNTDNKSEELAALGFPKGSNSMQVLTGGKLLTTKSQRAFIPQIDSLIEASQLPVEFGMSGGVLLSKINSTWVFAGMLSHQYLKRESSNQTITANLSNSTNIHQNDIAVSIPASDILDWYNKNDENNPETWVRLASNSNLPNETTISNAALNFKKINFKSDHVAIGGADGSGIGGENSISSENGSLLGIEISLNQSYIDQNPEAEFSDLILQQWYEWLLRGEKLTIIQLMKDSDSRTKSIQSFDQFVTLWQRDGFYPLVFRGNISDFDTNHLILIENLRSIQTTIKLLRNESLPKSLDSWLEYLAEKVIMIENLQIDVSELKNFKDPVNQVFWDKLYIDYFDLALELDKKLEGLK